MQKTAYNTKIMQQTDKNTTTDTPRTLLARIIGRNVEQNFGEPFCRIFSTQFAGKEEDEIVAASYICTLYLSAVLLDFPSYKLHTYTNNARQEWASIPFDCSKYDILLSYISDNELKQIYLIDKEGNLITRCCSRKEITEAFDFYTNT